MRIAFLLAAFTVAAGCSSGNLKTPDLGAPLDMATPAIGATQIAPATTLTTCLAADAARAYWSDRSSGSPQVVSVALAGGSVATIASGGDPDTCVAIDGDSAFFFDGDKLMKVSLAGGTP